MAFRGKLSCDPLVMRILKLLAELLLEYFTTFVPMLTWLSDQTAQLNNDIMHLVANTL